MDWDSLIFVYWFSMFSKIWDIILCALFVSLMPPFTLFCLYHELWLYLIVFQLFFSAVFVFISEVSMFFEFWHFYGVFIIFIFSELMLFFCLFYVVLSYDRSEVNSHLGYYLSFGCVGSCFLLISFFFSLSIAFYPLGNMFLLRWLGVLVSAFIFIVLELIEFSYIAASGVDNYYFSACYSLILLHLFHVGCGCFMTLWLILESIIFSYGRYDPYYMKLIKIYWHFVDFVWIIVYFIIYFL